MGRKTRNASRTSAMIWSWLFWASVAVAISVVLMFIHEGPTLDRGGLLTAAHLKLVLPMLIGATVLWAIGGWFMVAEGEFQLAEYGGVGNGLQRVRFRDGRVWELRRPLNYPFEVERPDGCALYVSVWENFLGQSAIRYYIVDLYSGELVGPDGRRG